MKKVLACALVAAMSATLLAGCGNSGSTSSSGSAATNAGASEATNAGTSEVTDVALKVWVPQNQVDSGIIEEQQKAFADAHPEWNITWTTEIVGEDVAKENILRDVEAAADVFFFASDQIVELVDAGAIARLGGETETMVNETIAESVVATAKVGEGLYGIPFTHNTFYM